MKLSEYLEKTKGLGLLATADSEGRVDIAVYARPHVIDEDTVAFIMANRLSHHNVQSNPHAAYLFKEEGPGYVGKRLFMTKIREEKDSAIVASLRRKAYPELKGTESVVYFRIDKVLPLIVTGEDFVYQI